MCRVDRSGDRPISRPHPHLAEMAETTLPSSLAIADGPSCDRSPRPPRRWAWGAQPGRRLDPAICSEIVFMHPRGER
jgi:hypothetical protein